MAMSVSTRSTALEPKVGGSRFTFILVVYGLVILTVALFVLFSILRPTTFPTVLNFQLLASAKAPLLIMALAVTVPMVTGKIDISVGYNAGLWQVLVLSWQINGMDYRIAIILALIGGALVGLLNALLVELAQVDAFLATMASGQVVYSITMWYTGGQQITDAKGNRAAAFDAMTSWSLFGIPGPFIIALLVALGLWIVLQYLPVGRFLYAVGANPAAAQLSGIPRRSCIVSAMISSGVLAALAGVLLASRQMGVAQANIGPDFLFPALAAAFLGSTTIKPGRVNAAGTVIGLLITTIGISGLQQLLPGKFYLEPLFNGLALIAAITIASIATRARISKTETEKPVSRTEGGGTESDSQIPKPE